MLLKIVRVCRRCVVEERLRSSRTFDCSTGFHVVPLSFGVCMCWAFKQVEQILKRINIRSQTKAVGCLLISPARLPDDIRRRYLMLSLFLSLFPSVLPTTSGETVLHRAASLCHRTICHYLVEAGASLMKTDMQVDPVRTCRVQKLPWTIYQLKDKIKKPIPYPNPNLTYGQVH